MGISLDSRSPTDSSAALAKVFGPLAALTSAAVVGAVATSGAAVVAHPFPGTCASTSNLLEPTMSGQSQRYFNSGLVNNGVTAMNRAHNNHSADTDMGWTAGSTSAPAVVRWDYGNDPSTSLAGWSDVSWGSDCLIDAHTNFLNAPHLDTRPDTIGEKQCIAVHELGHSVGLSHSNQTASILGLTAHTASESVMRGGEHSARCHVTDPPLRLRSADIADINAKY